MRTTTARRRQTKYYNGYNLSRGGRRPEDLYDILIRCQYGMRSIDTFPIVCVYSRFINYTIQCYATHDEVSFFERRRDIDFWLITNQCMENRGTKISSERAITYYRLQYSNTIARVPPLQLESLSSADMICNTFFTVAWWNSARGSRIHEKLRGLEFIRTFVVPLIPRLNI